MVPPPCEESCLAKSLASPFKVRHLTALVRCVTARLLREGLAHPEIRYKRYQVNEETCSQSASFVLHYSPASVDIFAFEASSHLLAVPPD